MANFTRTQPDSVWLTGYLPSFTDWRDLDHKTVAALNGGAGGIWAPSAGIAIGGAGIWMGAGSLSLLLAIVRTGPAKFIWLNAGTATDWITVNKTRSLLVSALHAYAEAGVFLKHDSVAVGVRPIATGVRFFMPIRVHDGATITDCTLYYTVGDARAPGVVPDILPRFRVVRVDKDGTVTPLRAPDATTDAEGFIIGTVSGGALSGDQTVLYTANQANIVDVAQYTYLAEIIEESGTNAWTALGNTFTTARTANTSITYLRFQ